MHFFHVKRYIIDTCDKYIINIYIYIIFHSLVFILNEDVFTSSIM